MDGENLTPLIREVHSRLKKEFGNLIPPLEERFLNETVENKTGVTPVSLASMIDHTLLRPEATQEQLKILCGEALEFGFKTVCVNSSNIPFVAGELKNSDVLPISVVGFPLGAMSTKAKVFETSLVLKEGAKEIDTVINMGRLKSGDLKFVLEDIKEVVLASKPYPVKVIIETALLKTEEKITASILSVAAKAEFVKTSTGFAGGGANEEDIRLIRMCVGNSSKIKASGGIKTYEDAVRMIKASADRIGCSASPGIMMEARQAQGKR